jgi:SAM-dependent methyltransferase
MSPDPTFSNAYEDAERASAYAQLEFAGTYYLAFRDLPALFEAHVQGTRALDFGCGAGRSTRFLKRLGYETVGVDISPAMLEQARSVDPDGDYRLITDDNTLADLPGPFDLILAAYPFDNIPTDAAKLNALQALRRVLAPGGRIVVIVSAPELYLHEWVSFSTEDFPENRTAGDGDRVRIAILDGPDHRPVDDILTSDARYRELFAAAGLTPVTLAKPLGNSSDGIAWGTETTVPPWSIHVVQHAELQELA